MIKEEWIQHAVDSNGYLDYRVFENGIDAAIMPLLFTYAIISEITNIGYGDRWCFKSYEAAKTALDAWDGTGEPEGWHRHPKTGRRRENGNEEVYF